MGSELAADICIHSYLDEDCIDCWKREYARAMRMFAAVVAKAGTVRLSRRMLNEFDPKAIDRYDDPQTLEVVFSVR